MNKAQDRGEPATPEQIFEIRLILIKYEDLDEAIAEAAKCDRYASQLDYSLGFTNFVDAAIATQGNGRMAVRFVHWRMEVLIADGFHEDALENGIRILRLARLYESEPTIVPFLVGIAMRNLTVPHIYDGIEFWSRIGRVARGARSRACAGGYAATARTRAEN